MIDVHSFVSYLLEYGLFGLFVVSFIGSTIFIPLAIEIFLAGLLGVGFNALTVVLIASLGSTLGSIINYLLGRMGIKYLEKKIKKDIKNTDKLQKIANKYGVLGLFIILAIPIPIPADIFTVVAGISKMEFKYFILAVFVAKLLKYSFYAGIVKAVI